MYNDEDGNYGGLKMKVQYFKFAICSNFHFQGRDHNHNHNSKDTIAFQNNANMQLDLYLISCLILFSFLFGHILCCKMINFVSFEVWTGSV